MARWIALPCRRFCLICFVFPALSVAMGDTMKRYSRAGDLNIGGLFPLHFYDETNQRCGGLRELGALKKIEAVVYTIDNINMDPTILPNITVGFDLYDTCSYDAEALRTSLRMVPLVHPSSNNHRCNASFDTADYPVVGIVGAQRSSSSKQAALLLGHYRIPQVSFLSTSDELSNTARYPYFLRTVAPDRFQVRVMIDLLRHFNWKYVSFLNSDDSFGKSAQREFRQQAGELDICLGIVRTISLYADDNTYDEVINDMYKQTSQTTVVILFAQLETVYGILSAATRRRAYRSFIWIGGDGWGNYNDLEGIRNYMQATLGAFTVAPLSKTLPDYDRHFLTEIPRHHDNPWLEEFWEKYGNCNSANSDSSSSTDDAITPREKVWCDPPSASVHETLVMDSTLAFTHALDQMQRDKCQNDTTIDSLCQEFLEALRSQEFLDYLLQTEFTSPANGRIKFTSAGDGGGKYALFNLQEVEGEDGGFAFARVGTWDEGSGEDDEALVLNQRIPWYLRSTPFDPETDYPKAVCSEVCQPGEKTSFFPENPCCWTCTKCLEYERLSTNGTLCVSCIDVNQGTYTWPSADFLTCERIQPVVNLTENAWASVMIILSTLGIIFTLILIVFYVINRDKRLIKASSRELSSLIFVGVFLSYVTSMLYILPPHPIICAVLRLGPPVANSLVYVSVGTKTVRLYRIFMSGRKSVKRPKFISPSFQVSITLIICTVPVTWVVVWLILVPPEVVLDMPNLGEPRVERTCSQRMVEKIGTMVWDLCLVFVCCVYAFRTRKLPNNYKESRFIAFCVFSTLLVLLAFLPTIFTTREPFYRSVYSALGLIVIATVANLCLFVIKLYAIYFVSEKDLVLATVNDRGGSSGDNKHQQQSTLSSNGPAAAEAAEQTDAHGKGDYRQPTNSISNKNMASLGVPNGGDTMGEARPCQVSAGDVNLGFDGDEDVTGGVYYGHPKETAKL